MLNMFMCVEIFGLMRRQYCATSAGPFWRRGGAGTDEPARPLLARPGNVVLSRATYSNSAPLFPALSRM
jgi:hypothetical protein